MRKRQFKKVLSLVLALAMVFSMNTSVFATGTVDAPVVETQTETQPENPVTNETETPAAEQPAAETPAEEPKAEEPAAAPAEESAPAEEPAKEETPAVPEESNNEDEQPAGSTVDYQGWTFTYTSTAPESTGSGGTTVVTLKEADMKIGETSNGSGDTIKIKSDGTGTGNVTLGTGKYVILNDGTTFSDTLTGITTSDATGVTIKKIKTQEIAPAGTTNYTIDKSQDGKWVVKAKDASQRLEYVVATTAGDSWADLDENTGADLTSADAEGGKKLFVRFKAVYNESDSATSGTITTAASDATEIEYDASADPSVANGDMTLTKGNYTISGLSITLAEGAKGSAISSNNGGIYVVTVSEGSATITARTTPVKAISLNALAKAQITIADFDDADKYGELSLKGAGDYLLDLSAAHRAEIESVESTASISANTGTALVISNNGAYKTVIDGKTEKQSVNTTGKAIVYVAVKTQPATPIFTQTKETNKITVNDTYGPGYVISDNGAKLSKIEAKTVYDLTKVAANDAIGYGKTVFKTDNETVDPANGFGYEEILERNTNPIKAVEFYPSQVGDKTASFHVTNPSDLNKTDINTKYSNTVKFAISTDATPYTKKWDNYLVVTGVLTGDAYANYEYTYALNKNYLTEGSELKPNTKYYVFTLNTDTKGFYSAPEKVGEFTTAAAQDQITLAAPTDTIYFGGQNKKKENALEAGVIGITVGTTGYTVKPVGNRLNVLDPSNSDAKVGEIKAYMYKRSTYYTAGNAEKINSAKTSDALTTGVTPDYRMAAGTDNLITAVSDNGYFIKAFFEPLTGTKYAGSEISSNVISFNVAPAPVKAEAQAASAPVKTKLVKSAFTVEPSIKYTNKITGENVNGSEFDGAPVYVTNGKRMYEVTSTVSYDTAGKYKYSISAGQITPSATAPGAAMYTLADADLIDGDLNIYGEVTLDSFTVTPGTVYYGEDAASIKSNMKVTYNNGADAAKAADNYEIKFYKKDAISSNGKVISNNSLTIANPEAEKAGTEMYAEITVAASKITAKDAKETKVVSPLITVQKRPVTVIVNKGKNVEKFSSYRNIEIKGTVSGSNADSEVSAVKEFNAKTHTFNGTAPALSGNAIFDMSYVDITTSGNYAVPLNDVKFTADNFSVQSATGYYVIKPAWYGYFILEYGGHDKKSTSKKTIYKVTKYTQTNDEKAAGEITWELPKEIANENALRTFNGAIDGKNDKVVSFEAQAGSKYNNISIKNVTTEQLLAKNVTTPDMYGDVYFYAVVQAYATEDVYVESITPKPYSGNKHNVNDDAVKAANGAVKDINLVVVDQSKNAELKLGTDYT